MRVIRLLPLVCLASTSAQAGTWSDLWSTREQQAQHLLDSNHPAAAAGLFGDARRRAYAELQAGQYAKAAERLAPFKDADSQYNRGNALAHIGKLREALAAYGAALAQSPGNRDVIRNRDLVARALEQQSPAGGQPNDTDSQSAGGPSGQSRRNGSPAPSNQSAQQQDGRSPDTQSGKQAQADNRAQGGNQAQAGSQPQAGSQSQAGSQAQAGNPAQPGNQSQAGGQSQAGSQAQAGTQAHAAGATPLQAQSNAAQSNGAAAGDLQSGANSGANGGGPDNAGRDAAAAIQYQQSQQSHGSSALSAHEANVPSAPPTGSKDSQPPPPRSEQALALDQWLRGIPEDSGELLQRKFLIEHMMRQQGNQQ
jgi:Ca-activated chloride channel family protein